MAGSDRGGAARGPARRTALRPGRRWSRPCASSGSRSSVSRTRRSRSPRAMQDALVDAEHEVDRVDALLTAAEGVGGRIDGASRLVTQHGHQPGGEGRSRSAPARSRRSGGSAPASAAPPAGGPAMIPKRVFWLTVGYGAGLGSSWYTARKVKAAARRYTPEGLDRPGRRAGRRREGRGGRGSRRHAPPGDAVTSRAGHARPAQRPVAAPAAGTTPTSASPSASPGNLADVMTADELRRAFLDFFVARGHTEVPVGEPDPARQDGAVHRGGHGPVQAVLHR